MAHKHKTFKTGKDKRIKINKNNPRKNKREGKKIN